MWKHFKNNFQWQEFVERLIAVISGMMAVSFLNLDESFFAAIILAVGLVDPRWFK